MEIRILLVLLIITCSMLTTSAINNCDVKDREDCIYTVVCETYAGSAYTPECSYEPYVTFVITKSSVDTLTAGFFGSTNFDSRVRIIRGVGNSWQNIETLTFKYYSKTIIMDISNNGIQNIKNEAFKNLFALTSLNVSNNAIQSINSKTFHMSETRISALEILDLSHNLITDLGENVFSDLQNLQKLYLQNNKIMAFIDTAFHKIPKLFVLDLSNNKIYGLNTTLSELRSLKNLDVSYNQLTHLHGYETNVLTTLETVNMSHNLIEDIESNCFNQAFNLVTIDFSYNRIRSVIESIMFINNNKLKYLNFYENNITRIQDNAFQHNILLYLNLEKNNLTGEITSNTFSGINGLTTLNLSNQHITSIRKDAFSDATNLVYLNLSQNNINVIENSSLTALTLNILDISHNNVSNINFLKDSSVDLREIYLQDNSLFEIPQKAFDNQTLLTKLDISQNNIEKIAENSLPLENLQFLNLNGNCLVGDLNSNVFSPAKYLRYLDLSYFKLKRINEMALVDLPVLARLNISHNELEFIDPKNFIGMDNIYSLDLSFNKLPCFYLNNSSLINLKALYLNNNNLSNISQTLTNMTGLLYVDLSNNNISDLSEVSFTSSQNLKVLHLSQNNIRVFNNPEINSLVKLTDLSIAGNRLTEIDLSFFSDLVSVDLSYNNISFFNSLFFKNLDSLQSIDLSGNGITRINPGTFRNLKILKFVNLSHNMLSTVRYGSFRGLNRTEVLDLSYNNLTNIDVDVFHECHELRRLTIDYNHLKSIDVERLVATLPKLTTLSIGGNLLACKEIVRNIKTVNRNLIRQVDVTSINKIFHEDNVHGITCGDTNSSLSTEKPTASPSVDSTSFGLVIWCSLLTVIILITGVGLFLYKTNYLKTALYEQESRLQFRNSVSRFSDTNDSLLS